MNDFINTGLKEIINEFLHSQNLSHNAFLAYNNDFKYITSKYSSIYEINNKNELLNIYYYIKEKYSINTIKRKWSSLKELFRYCININIISHACIFDIDTHLLFYNNKIHNKIYNNLPSKDDIENFCDSPKIIKHKAILWFLYCTGARINEIINNAHIKNINLISREFYINNNRTIFMSHKLVNLLKEYFESRNTISVNDAIFIRESDGQPLSHIDIYNIFQIYKKHASINININTMRMCMARSLIENGATEEDILYLLGYKSVKSIEKYIIIR